LLRKGVVKSRILPTVQRLVTDASEHVRASLASVISALAPSLGREDTVTFLLPILLLLLRDDVSEVRAINE
jgi:serine/threonine-protein phosphatase 2A regulatory subunit A